MRKSIYIISILVFVSCKRLPKECESKYLVDRLDKHIELQDSINYLRDMMMEKQKFYINMAYYKKEYLDSFYLSKHKVDSIFPIWKNMIEKDGSDYDELVKRCESFEK